MTLFRKVLVFLIVISSVALVSVYLGKSSQTLDNKAVPLEKEKLVFLGMIIKNDDQLIPAFLKSMDRLDYDKKSIAVQIHLYNNNPYVKEMVQDWIKENKNKYRQIVCTDTKTSSGTMNYNVERFKLFGKIKNEYLSRTRELGCDYCFIIESDAFIAPYTLKMLVAMNRPIITPLLRPVPDSNTSFRNFFADVSPQGYYRDHHIYLSIADRMALGTFNVPCVHGVYLIQSRYVDRLSYVDDTEDWEFLAFSRSARKNHIDQFICNEKEFGFFLHFKKEPSEEEEKAFSLVSSGLIVPSSHDPKSFCSLLS